MKNFEEWVSESTTNSRQQLLNSVAQAVTKISTKYITEPVKLVSLDGWKTWEETIKGVSPGDSPENMYYTLWFGTQKSFNTIKVVINLGRYINYQGNHFIGVSGTCNRSSWKEDIRSTVSSLVEKFFGDERKATKHGKKYSI